MNRGALRRSMEGPDTKSTGGDPAPSFQKPSAIEALFNSALGWLVGLGIGPAYMQLLQVRVDVGDVGAV